MGVPPGVGALLVEVVPVANEVAAKRGELGNERARECRPPAFFEDRPLHPLHAAVGLRSAGVDEAVLRAQLGHRGAEAHGPELVRW